MSWAEGGAWCVGGREGVETGDWQSGSVQTRLDGRGRDARRCAGCAGRAGCDDDVGGVGDCDGDGDGDGGDGSRRKR